MGYFDWAFVALRGCHGASNVKIPLFWNIHQELKDTCHSVIASGCLCNVFGFLHVNQSKKKCKIFFSKMENFHNSIIIFIMLQKMKMIISLLWTFGKYGNSEASFFWLTSFWLMVDWVIFDIGWLVDKAYVYAMKG